MRLPRIGSHLSISKGMDKAAQKAASWQTRTFQFFSSNPRSFRPRPVKPDEAKRTLTVIHEHDIRPVAHAPYLFNLCHPKDETWELTCELVRTDLESSSAYGAAAVVVHSGKHVGQGLEAGLRRMAMAIDRVLDGYEADARLLIENTAGQGTELGSTLEEMAILLELIQEPDRLGFCLDSCHAFAAGAMHPDNVDGYVTKAISLLGRKRIGMIHLNDSKIPFDGRQDRHALLGQGEMGPEPLKQLLTHPELQDAIFIIETPVSNEDEYLGEIERCRQWFKEATS